MPPLRQRVRTAANRVLSGRVAISPFRPDQVESQLVWMLGGPRTGSTWLLNLLALHDRVRKINEPEIGYHLAPFYPELTPGMPVDFDAAVKALPATLDGTHDYFFSDEFDPAWRPPLRRLLLARLWAQGLAPDDVPSDSVVVIKEPHSQAAEILLSVLPRSRILFLVRDPRDALGSLLAVVDSGGWLAREMGIELRQPMTPAERLRFLEAYSYRWLQRTEAVQRAYEAHPRERRLMARYEDVRADPESELSRIFAWLGVETTKDEVRTWVESLAFEALPPDQKGKGQFARSAKPGSWRTDFTPEEQRSVEQRIGPKLSEFGYEAGEA
jgi:hypothetical protein